MKACCVTGHGDIPGDKVGFVENALRQELRNAVNDGFTRFLSGFAPGVDMIFARLILELQSAHPQIRLEAALPYPAWFKNRSPEEKKLLSRCAEVKSHCQRYGPNCFFIRNRFLAITCERVIAICDGPEEDGTVSTLQYAALLERDIRVIEI